MKLFTNLEWGGRIITVNKLVYVVDRIITNIQRAVLLNWKLFRKLTLNILYEEVIIMKKELYIKKIQKDNDLQKTFDNTKYAGPALSKPDSK